MAADAAETAEDGRKGRVLVVDDEAGISGLLRRWLSRDGYSVRIAADGAQALAAIAEEPPDVILLDVVMPDMDGFTICRRLKNDPSTRLTPVILVTGLADRDTRID